MYLRASRHRRRAMRPTVVHRNRMTIVLGADASFLSSPCLIGDWIGGYWNHLDFFFKIRNVFLWQFFVTRYRELELPSRPAVIPGIAARVRVRNGHSQTEKVCTDESARTPTDARLEVRVLHSTTYQFQRCWQDGRRDGRRCCSTCQQTSHFF